MKHILIGLFVIVNLVCTAQAKLGMVNFHIFSTNDTVYSGTSVVLTTIVKNVGISAFTGTFAVVAKLDTSGLSGSYVPLAIYTSSTTLFPGDSISATSSFTPNAGQNGWRSSGNGNTIVVWPISSGALIGDSVRATMVVLDFVGISEYSKSGFIVFPNPSNDKIYIKQPSGVSFKQIKIYDMLSREIKNEAFSEMVDIKELQSGSYWILISSDAKIYRQKLIKE